MGSSEIVAATRNPGKLREIRQVLEPLGLRVRALEDDGVPEPEETGTTFAENARQKALYYARATGRWCLADDSGLVVDALGGEPGVRSARFAEEAFPPGADRSARDRLNNLKLLAAMWDVSDERRTARFMCRLALASADGVIVEAGGAVEGRILRSGRGENGFGYDPLFHVEAKGHTVAELPAEEKNAISHRGQALRDLAEKLSAMFDEGSRR
jgi:XTP/dITP diphosphohydrolase